MTYNAASLSIYLSLPLPPQCSPERAPAVLIQDVVIRCHEGTRCSKETIEEAGPRAVQGQGQGADDEESMHAHQTAELVGPKRNLRLLLGFRTDRSWIY